MKVKTLIDAKGRVADTEVISDGGDSRLLHAALEGIRESGLTPGTIDGTPQEMWVDDRSQLR